MTAGSPLGPKEGAVCLGGREGRAGPVVPHSWKQAPEGVEAVLSAAVGTPHLCHVL